MHTAAIRELGFKSMLYAVRRHDRNDEDGGWSDSLGRHLSDDPAVRLGYHESIRDVGDRFPPPSRIAESVR